MVEAGEAVEVVEASEAADVALKLTPYQNPCGNVGDWKVDARINERRLTKPFP